MFTKHVGTNRPAQRASKTEINQQIDKIRREDRTWDCDEVQLPVQSGRLGVQHCAADRAVDVRHVLASRSLYTNRDLYYLY